MEPRLVRRRRTPVLFVAAMGLVACGGGGDDVTSPPIGPDAYVLVLDEFLPEPPTDPDAERPVVYVAHLGDEIFSLDDQVAMIDAVAETHDLRFVDDADAAVDDREDSAPPRDDGLLLGIGTITATPPHLVRVEVYNEADAVEAHLLTLTERAGTWRVETSEPVDPEGLVSDG